MANNELLNEVKKEVSKANQRLARLESQFGKDTWASKKLSSKLDNETLGAWSSASRIKIPKDVTPDDLERIKKATEEFLRAKTSTVRGVKSQIKSIKGGFKKTFDISDEEAEAMYQAFNEDLINWILRYIEPSEFWQIIQEAKEKQMSYESFERLIEDYIAIGNDDDIREKLEQIYERYVEG